VVVAVRVDDTAIRQMGKVLRGTGKEFRRELFAAAQRTTRPVKDEIKQAALNTLPSGGGLNEWVSKIGIKTRNSLGGRTPGLFIVGTIDNKREVRKAGGKRRKLRKRGTFGARADLRAIDRGRVMHPIFGHLNAEGKLAGPQMVKAGFWTNTLTGPVAERAKGEYVDAMKAVARKVAAQASQQ
jgi:hypothetical protein